MLPPVAGVGAARERTNGGRSAPDEILKTIDERRAHAFEPFRRRVQIPQPHLLQVLVRRLLALAISPGHERKQRPPRVADERDAAFPDPPDRIHRILQPRGATTDRSLRSRLADEERPTVATPVQF